MGKGVKVLLRKLGSILCIIITITVLSAQAVAATETTLPPLPTVWGCGGVCEEQSYEELIFLTGEPVAVTGTVTIRQGRARNNKMDTTYSYRLETGRMRLS